MGKSLFKFDFNEEVYFIHNEKYVSSGKVKSRTVEDNGSGEPKIEYLIIADDDSFFWGGIHVYESDLFTSKKEAMDQIEQAERDFRKEFKNQIRFNEGDHAYLLSCSDEEDIDDKIIQIKKVEIDEVKKVLDHVVYEYHDLNEIRWTDSGTSKNEYLFKNGDEIKKYLSKKVDRLLKKVEKEFSERDKRYSELV